MPISIAEDCTLRTFNKSLLELAQDFDCENDDLNDFFKNDALEYANGLVGKTYCFTLDNNQQQPVQIVAFFTVSNDGIKSKLLTNSRKKKLTQKVKSTKRMANYPAVMVGRLGVDKQFRKLQIGTQIMNFIKVWFSGSTNKTGCRYILVDAYSIEQTLNFYLEKCNFQYLFSSEESERKYTNDTREGDLSTRLLFFDLIELRVE